MKLRNALLLTSLTPMVVLFAAVRNERSSGSHYGFENIPAPATNDAATGAVFRLVGGKADPAAASLDVLHDGRIPRGPDEPGSNFFFAPGSGGGRILLDLKKSIEGYREDLWKTWTGKSLAELGAEWKEAHRKRLGL